MPLLSSAKTIHPTGNAGTPTGNGSAVVVIASLSVSVVVVVVFSIDSDGRGLVGSCCCVLVYQFAMSFGRVNEVWWVP